MKDTALRSLVKGFSWRFFATIDTILLSLLITGNIDSAIKIGLGEIFSKTALYFLHERLWNSIKNRYRLPSHIQSLLKGISWSILGTLDTFMIAFIFIGKPLMASQIAIVEVLTKIALYYLHERVWEQINWGRFNFIPKTTILEECSLASNKNEQKEEVFV